MIIQALPLVSQSLTLTPHVQFKAIFNEKGIIFGTTRIEHKTLRCDEIFYADEGEGNALAVIFDGFKFEIRLHPGFSPERVNSIFKNFDQDARLKWIAALKITYGGKMLS